MLTLIKGSPKPLDKALACSASGAGWRAALLGAAAKDRGVDDVLEILKQLYNRSWNTHRGQSMVVVCGSCSYTFFGLGLYGKFGLAFGGSWR